MTSRHVTTTTLKKDLGLCPGGAAVRKGGKTFKLRDCGFSCPRLKDVNLEQTLRS